MNKKALALLAALALVPVVSGAKQMIQNKGSDTLVNVAQAWAEEYQKVKPDVAIAVTGGGSGTGIASLINGTVDIANSSRKLKEKEMKEAESKGHKPVEFLVGHDALAIFVHKDNPIPAITVAQLAEIYGDGGTVEAWDQLNVKVPGCKDGKIILISRQNNSGTYIYFQEAILGENRDFRLGTRDMHGSKDVVDLVEKTPCAIGYSGLAYSSPNVKMVPVKKDDAAPAVAPSEDAALDGSYPIARPLFMYTLKAPEGDIKDYMDWILGDVGQCLIKSKGYSPVRKIECKK